MRPGLAFAAIQADETNTKPPLDGTAATCEADQVPASIAIAGIYGYIGQLIYNAAVDAGVSNIFGFDPVRGRRPSGIPIG